MTENEGEAHALVKRHLERSLGRSEIVVLNRNNSQNRLDAATPVPLGSLLAEKLVDSSPNSCLAVRLGRTHAQSTDDEPLLTCDLCSQHSRTTCVPSLVGGEVIGSVLVAHERPLSASERGRIDQSVSQAAPCSPTSATSRSPRSAPPPTRSPACRTRAASARASSAWWRRRRGRISPSPRCSATSTTSSRSTTSSGTKRATRRWPRRAPRSGRRSARATLAGRYGGEEFLILLPDTPLEGAVVLAEKLRNEVELVSVPGVDRAITASFGVASFPADTPDGDMLVRMADRALYAAKALGRNCVVTSAELLAASAGARQPAPAWCRRARRATSARPGASRTPRGRRLPSRR